MYSENVSIHIINSHMADVPISLGRSHLDEFFHLLALSASGFQIGVRKDKMGVRGLTYHVKFKVYIFNVWIFIFIY